MNVYKISNSALNKYGSQNNSAQCKMENLLYKNKVAYEKQMALRELAQ